METPHQNDSSVFEDLVLSVKTASVAEKIKCSKKGDLVLIKVDNLPPI